VFLSAVLLGDLMKDNNKTKKQLIDELTELRSQNAELEKSITGSLSYELAAEEARRYAESIVGTVREPLLVLDADLKIISANRNFYKTFKVMPDETIGSFIYDLGNKQWDIPKLRELLEEVLPEKEAFDDFEVDHHFQDIGHKIMLLNARQIYRKDIGTKMILLAIEDITERKQLESLLIDSEQQYRRLFETASDGIVLLEKREGKITQTNPATEKLLGYTENDSIGNKLEDIGVVIDASDFQTTMQNLNKSGIINYRNVKVETKSGHHIDTEIYLVDRAKLVQCNIRDITEHKRAQEALKEALRQSEEKYRWLVDNMADVITVMDMNLRFTYVSPSIKRMRGYTPEEAVAQTFEQVMTPESLQISARIIEEELQLEASGTADPGRIRIVEVEQYRKDGSIVLMENHLSFMRDEAKKAVGIISVSHDITARKWAEVNLKESKELTEAVVENVPLMIFLKEAVDLRFVIFNRAGEELLGYDRKVLLGKSDLDLFPPVQAAHFMAKDREVLDGESDILDIPEEPILTAKKGQRLLHTRKVCIKGADGATKYLLGISEDITERKQAEEELQRTLESLRKSFAATIQVMVAAVESRDPYTAGHQIRSADLARAIATEMGLPPEKIDGIRTAGAIHDIGKLSIPAEILSKPTKLSAIELSLIKEHSLKGYEMLKDVESPWPLAEMVYQHHERMDGSGYPRNLKGDEILMEARILAVADVVEAMASHRPYRPGLGIDAALKEIEKNKGIFYDDAVADACLRLFREKGFILEGT
jgi:PAS domain S-box-containing protein